MAVPTYKGPFGSAQAERLLWRAGFGPRPGEAKRLAHMGLARAVASLTRPPAPKLVGPAPTDDKGRPIAPGDASGHDHLWWLDRMVRTTAPLVERMTLVWHDWFATSNQGVGSQQLMLGQNELFRSHALGSFADLLVGVTKDPAMLIWLNGNKNSNRSPNENYARELMELFTLGASRGYTEADVREQARALTGWRGQKKGATAETFSYDPRFHDNGMKTIFGATGNYDWQAACRLCVSHPLHAAFAVRKLWSYFVPTAPAPATQAALEALYRRDFQVRPVVEAILRHPDLYRGPRMIKPPAVYAAGLLRARGRGIDTAAWTKLGLAAGQRLFYPPNVAGWDETRWLDTATFRGRWYLAATALRPALAAPAAAPADAAQLVSRAIAYWGTPTVSAPTRKVLASFATAALRDARPPTVENALRQLVAVSPDLQTC
jgi:uncharacterized protein (DUF1800 family)